MDQGHDLLVGDGVNDLPRRSGAIQAEQYVALHWIVDGLMFVLSVPPTERYPSELLRQNFFRLASSYRPMLLSHGFHEDVVDRWIAKTREEIYTMKLHMYSRVS